MDQHYPILDLAHVGQDFLRLDLITHLSQTTDECGNPIVELWFIGSQREIYGAEAAAPIVAWFTAQATHFAKVQRAMAPPATPEALEEQIMQRIEARLLRLMVPEE